MDDRSNDTFTIDAETRRSRPSNPLESTRMTTKSTHVKVEPDDQGSMDHGLDKHETTSHVADNLDLTDANQTMDESIQNDEPLKQEFSGLNKRLLSYMDRLKRHEVQLAELKATKSKLEEQLELTKQDHCEQIRILRSELDQHIRETVMAKEQEENLGKELSDCRNELSKVKDELEKQRSQSNLLQCNLVEEKQASKKIKQELENLQSSILKERDEKKRLQEERLALKVDNAKLGQEMKVKTLELTMQESRVSEFEKKLQFTQEDVNKKLAEQRTHLEKIGYAKILEITTKHEQALSRQKEELESKFQSTLASYVKAEDKCKIESELKETQKLLEQARIQLEQCEEKLKVSETKVRELIESRRIDAIHERKRREKLNKRILDEKKVHDEIREELENYRRLVDNLDLDETAFKGTPIGAKRARPSLEMGSPLRMGNILNRSIENTPKTADVRRALLKKALTPRRRRNSDGEKAVPENDANCRMM